MIVGKMIVGKMIVGKMIVGKMIWGKMIWGKMINVLTVDLIPNLAKNLTTNNLLR